MDRSRKRALRSAILALVLAAHILGLTLLSLRRATHPGAPVETQVLLLTDQRLAPTVVKPAPARARADRSPVPSSERISEGPPITSMSDSPSAPKTDWRLESEITVAAMMPKLDREQRRRCEEARWTHEARPFGCPKRYYDQAWQPSGDLLKDMHDPDRPRGGAPDPLADAFLAPPLPVVLQDQDPQRAIAGGH